MFVPGAVALWAAFLALLGSTFYYWRALRGDDAARERARQAYSLACFAVVLATGVLLYLILAHDFRVHYVYSYSDRALSTPYLVSTLWAGQEGSFLLWLFWGMLIGLLLTRFAREDEPEVLIPYNLAQLSLVLILLRQSPFRFLDGLAAGQMPADGQGLNPLLQNPWMTIHPPIMFIGYAATAVPFALAIAALWRRRYDQWAARALPWALLTLITLGLAIMLGGYWAYVTLGWGGYWGWDPVENSSLVPWITSAALVHGLLLQKARGRFRRLNFALGILTFVLVVYAIFLNRLGVMADFSVHSFVDLGITAWLVGNLVVFLLLGIGFLAWRWREIPSQHGDEPFWTRTVLTVVGIGVLLGAAAMVLLGTSAPLLTRLATKPSQVGPAFYNQVMLPIGIALALLLALIPHLGWKETGDKLRVRLPVSGAVALMATAAALGLGARGGLYLAFLAAAVFAAASNAWRLVGATRAGSISRAGAHLTHLGLTLMLVGIITSSGFDRSQKVTLPEGAEVHAFDRTLVFQGVDTQSEPGKQHMLVQVRQGSGTPWLARPVMWKNPKSGQLVANPDLHVGLAHDIYIAPVEINPGRSAEPDGVIELGKGESQAVGAATLTFQDFDRGGGHAEGQQLSVGATLTLALSGEPTRTVVPRLGMSEKGMTSSREALLGIPGGWVEVAGINADLGRVRLKLGGIPGVHAAPGEPASFVAELTIKPGISLVWIGLLVLLAGATLALARRRSETALAGPPAPAETPAT